MDLFNTIMVLNKFKFGMRFLKKMFMKKISRLLFLTVIATGVFTSIQAQRNAIRIDRGRSNINSNVQPRTERSYRNVDLGSRNAQVNRFYNYNRIINNTPERNEVALPL